RENAKPSTPIWGDARSPSPSALIQTEKQMTVRELLVLASYYPWHLTTYFVVVPVVSGLLVIAHGPGRGDAAPWKYLYSALIHMTCIPGILAAIVTGYSLFFTRENLLDANVLVYILPIASMAVTLIIIRRNVSFDDIPGFDRISGLMILLAVTFVLVLGIQRTRIWLFFGSSILTLIALTAVLFALLKWGTYLLFRQRNPPRIKPPSFHGKR
ncbi:MAG: hypothetical protein RDU20_06830, partial [Desulfomonilaceae bacterium]|nr:hypothetical protein [Desulfomonilaceae bacterium]